MIIGIKIKIFNITKLRSKQKCRGVKFNNKIYRRINISIILNAYYGVLLKGKRQNL